MEFWEFLLQKEGERSWLPIKSPNIEIEAGRYRVVAHSSRINTDVEICVTHDSIEEVPPKRRSQKRSRRTNPEGLMVVIPFTYLKPGRWELRCCGDIMSDFLGKSWQKAIRLQVLPKPQDVLPTEPVLSVVNTTESEVEAASSENSSSHSVPDLAIKPTPSEAPQTSITAASAVREPEVIVKNGANNKALENSQSSLSCESETPVNSEAVENSQSSTLSHESETPANSENIDEHQPLPITFVDVDTLIPLDLPESDENQVELSGNSTNGATSSNPILDRSLQMLEQILQQVLDPVLQDLDPPESPEPEQTELEQIPVTPELELPPERQGLILTLEDDAYTARRGQPLTITGQVDVLDVNQLNGSEPDSFVNSVFQGNLRYQLRDPQTSQVLLDVQQPLPEQPLPLAFNHTLDIPPDCKTRLILGKVTLYGSSPVALTSQPFTISADLDELLGAILPGTKVMPVAKMLVLANKFTSVQENSVEENEANLSELAEAPLAQAPLNLIDVQSSPSLPLEPASPKPLPPQIYHPTPSPKGSKSLNLPNFPRVSPVATNTESSAAQEKREDTVEQPVALADDLSPETPNSLQADTAEDNLIESPTQEALQQSEDDNLDKDVVLEVDSASSIWDETTVPEPLVAFVDVTSDASESLKPAEIATSTAENQQKESQTTKSLDTPEPDSQATEVRGTEPKADESTSLDNAFQALKVQDRFWLRLNSMAADAELSFSLRSELSPPHNLEATQPLNSHPAIAEVEEVTQSLNFDESMWEESDELGSKADTAEPPPPPEENTSLEEATPIQPPPLSVGDRDWADREIVVEDEEPPTQKEPIVNRPIVEPIKPITSVSSKPELKIPAPLKPELPLPAPTLFIPTSELAAGEPVTVRVKLPPHSARLCVKLWVQDRQSRYLLDGPRWLVDLLPDGAGQLEAMTQLVIPFGSAEIRVEAIAIDLDSQRESHKVAVDCVVLPPDLPNFSLDEFEA
ncbi:MAG TPA: hypothetical protein V6D35_19805 [Candidatus Sericytochromatia bacterium]